MINKIMTNNELLGWLNIVRIALGQYNNEIAIKRDWKSAITKGIENRDAEALAQLRLMLSVTGKESLMRLAEKLGVEFSAAKIIKDAGYAEGKADYEPNEPTDEERKNMLEFLKYIRNEYLDDEEMVDRVFDTFPLGEGNKAEKVFEVMMNKILALIESKRTVTNKWIDDFTNAIYAAIKKAEVGKLIEKKLAELGVEMKK